MLTKLDRYLLRQFSVPLFTTLIIAALLLILERMLRLFDFVVNQGGPVKVVWQMLGNLIPHYIVLALPVGLFLGILLTFRKLSLNSELDAIRASGFGLFRMMKPAMFLSLIALVVNLVLLGFIQPHSRFAYRDLVFELRSGALGASIKTGEFVSLPNDIVLRVEQSRNNGSELLGIFVQRTDADGRQIAVSAQRGGFFSTNDRRNVFLRLYDGRLVDLSETQERPRVLSFNTWDLPINLPQLANETVRGESQNELTITQLWTGMMSGNLNEVDQNGYRAHFHWQLSNIFLFLFFPFLAATLGISNKRQGEALGIVVGLALIVLYNELQEVCRTIVANGTASPYATTWILFALYCLLTYRLFYISARKVGGDPLRWATTCWLAIRRPVLRVFARTKKVLGT